jgi:hypothetical protein
VFQYGRCKPRNYSFVSSLHLCRPSAQCNRIALRKDTIAELGVLPASDDLPRFVLLLAFLGTLLTKPTRRDKTWTVLCVKMRSQHIVCRCVAMAVKVILARYSLG